MKVKGGLLFLSICGWTVPSHLSAIPKTVIIIRHAEKDPGHYSLNLKGHYRAAALPYYFTHTPLYNTPPISHIFAANLEGSNLLARTVQTCKPTADAYDLSINATYKHKDTFDIAQELLTNPKYNDSTVLICWTHGHVDELVTALGGEHPGQWSKDIFDQVDFLTFEQGKKPKLQKILQKLMFGDRTSFEGK